MRGRYLALRCVLEGSEMIGLGRILDEVFCLEIGLERRYLA